MRIAFVDLGRRDFNVETVDREPMGGSESAACYLARELSRLGHQVWFFNHISKPGVYGNVQCLKIGQSTSVQVQALQLNAVLCVRNTGAGTLLRQLFGPKTRLILWNQDSHDQASVAPLANPQERNAYDSFAMVSQWQQLAFQRHFGLDPSRTFLLPNAISPVFENLFQPDSSILSIKSRPAVLAYASAPGRGLDILVDAFPRIRQAAPGTRLQVFSSLRTYAFPDAVDQTQFGTLYRQLRTLDGVEYHGGVPQRRLAEYLRQAAILAYPNTYAETNCIVAQEAMAAGCRVVSSHLGALPEIAAGFAELLELGNSREAYIEKFVARTVAVLHELQNNAQAVEQHLRRQVQFIHENRLWSLRARELPHLIQTI